MRLSECFLSLKLDQPSVRRKGKWFLLDQEPLLRCASPRGDMSGGSVTRLPASAGAWTRLAGRSRARESKATRSVNRQVRLPNFLTVSFPGLKTYILPTFKEKGINDVVRIGNISIFYLSKVSNPRPLYCVM